MSSTDTHIDIKGIKGESNHEKHKDQIEVIGWQWSASNDSTFGIGKGGGKGKGTVQNLVFTHRYDNASPTLAKKCLAGEHIDTATLYVSKASGGQEDFLIITLTGVMVTSVNPSGDSSGEIFETVSLAYEEFKAEYKVQDAKGKLSAGPQFTFNVASTKVS